MQGTPLFYNLGQNLRKIRVATGLTQTNISINTGIDQARLSKLENGKDITLDTSQMYSLSQYFGISIDNLISGRINFNKVSKKLGLELQLPKNMLDLQYSTVRVLLPYINYLDSTYGTKYTDLIFKHLKVERHYFVDPNQPISVHICMEFSQFCLERRLVDEKSYNDFSKFIYIKNTQGSLFDLYNSQTSPLSVVNLFASSSSKYASNFINKIEDYNSNQFEVSITPNTHMEEVKYKAYEVPDFLCRYLKSYLETLVRHSCGGMISIEEPECHYHKGADKCVYKIRVA